MRSDKLLYPFVATILFTLACFVGSISQPTPAPALTEAPPVIPRPTRQAFPTTIPANPTPTPIPSWITDFANPIIEAVSARKPDIRDDFSINLNWINIMSGEAGYFYPEIQDGMLFLKLPERTKDSILYNPRMNRRNFLLTFDLRFYHGQPDDTVRFQFDQSADQSVALDLSNNRNWKFHWGYRDDWQSMAGIYEHFPPERIPMTIIMQGTKCAVYLNHDPLMYLSNCRSNPIFQSREGVVSFRLLRDTGRAVTVNFDNLNLWDLDKTRGLPK